jgi:hypothetical protein
VVIGRHDTMVNLPDHKLKTEAGLPHLLDARDADAYGAVAAEWRELSGQKRADGASTAGSFTAWMNVHRGVPTFATTLWGRPDIPEPPAAPEGPAPRAAPKPADEEAAAWLAYSDRVRGGAGFVPWKSVNHPQLRDAEVGGWVAGFRENPPIEELPAIGGRVAGFLGKLADRRPRLVLAAPTATEISPGTWRICAVLRNEGKLPTAMRTGLENRTVPAHVLRISTPLERVRSGQRVTMMRAVESGASMPMEWIVTAAPGEPIELTLAHRGKPVGGWRVTDGAVTPVPAEAPAGGVR